MEILKNEVFNVFLLLKKIFGFLFFWLFISDFPERKTLIWFDYPRNYYYYCFIGFLYNSMSYCLFWFCKNVVLDLILNFFFFENRFSIIYILTVSAFLVFQLFFKYIFIFFFVWKLKTFLFNELKKLLGFYISIKKNIFLH